jgi:bifunctional ADP-heptose synthase (sugar kinase/adenylyltransferase)
MKELATTQQQTPFNVLLIGDSCIDQYYIGSCDRLSPEAPVPVIKIIDNYTTKGMAANVFENLKMIGVDADFITNNQKITKTRYIDERSKQHLLRVDDEPDIVPWSGRIATNVNSYDAVVISDYNKGFLTYEHIVNIRKEFTGPIFIDTKKTDLARFEGCFIKINALEYSQAKSFPEGVPSGLIVTMGNRGARYNDTIYPSASVEVVDVCGAGDTFLASLVYEYLNTRSIEMAIKFANKASAVTVTHTGVYAPSKEEIAGMM